MPRVSAQLDTNGYAPTNQEGLGRPPIIPRMKISMKHSPGAYMLYDECFEPISLFRYELGKVSEAAKIMMDLI